MIELYLSHEKISLLNYKNDLRKQVSMNNEHKTRHQYELKAIDYILKYGKHSHVFEDFKKSIYTEDDYLKDLYIIANAPESMNAVMARVRVRRFDLGLNPYTGK